jgi:HTH-type transcriptional regulator / antitoxin HigA
MLESTHVVNKNVRLQLTYLLFESIMESVDQTSLFEPYPRHPGKYLKEFLDAKGWIQDDLAAILGKSRQAISEIVSGKTGITLDMAVMLAVVFGNTAQEWLKWDQTYRLATADRDVADVEGRARLYETAPIREMTKRGWIQPAMDANALRAELEMFYGIDPLSTEISFPVATKRTVKLHHLKPAEMAWCFRARQLAGTMLCGEFSNSRFEKAQPSLRRLTVHPKEAARLPQILSDCGVRFVVIEPLPDVQIDGAAFWDDRGPVIAVSLRHDRIDGFWFTVMHECSHIRHGDPLSVDTQMIDGAKGVVVPLADDVAEQRANEEAAASLVPPDELDSFMRRVGPLYERRRVIQFANRLKIHPGIIVGQLQHRRELAYALLREFLVKVRDQVTATALTDGWGHMIAPSTLGR